MRTPLNIFAALSLCAATIDSQAAAIRCDACNETAYLERAEAAGPGRHFVYDLYNRRVSEFEVYYEYELRSNVGAEVPMSLPWVPTLVGALSDLFQESGGSMIASLDVNASELGLNAGDSDTAYGALSDLSVRTRIGDRLAQVGIPTGDSPARRIMDMVSSFGFATTGLTDGTLIYVTVTFDDGSTMTFLVRPGNPHSEYQNGSGRDANGNPLLEANGPEYAGTTFDLSDPRALERFLELARSRGISIGGPSGVPQRQLECTWDGTRLNCRWVEFSGS